MGAAFTRVMVPGPLWLLGRTQGAAVAADTHGSGPDHREAAGGLRQPLFGRSKCPYPPLSAPAASLWPQQGPIFSTACSGDLSVTAASAHLLRRPLWGRRRKCPSPPLPVLQVCAAFEYLHERMSAGLKCRTPSLRTAVCGPCLCYLYPL